MNKTERQFAITLELQRHKKVRAEDLAQQFETSVRTIYRDMQALSEAGVPIVGAPGQGYSLMEGYFLPPIGFTAKEAVALLVGMDFIGQSLEKDYGEAAKSMIRKVEAVLPEPIQAESRLINDTMKLMYNGIKGENQQEKEYLEKIRQAILQRHKLSFHYIKSISENDGNRKSTRVVEPYGLTLLYGNWVLIAYCELRQSIRHFRLTRMSELDILDDEFTFPDHFTLEQYRPKDDRQLEVVLRLHGNVIDKITEESHFYLERVQRDIDGTLVIFRVRQVEELLPSILSWGSKVEVIEPQYLRKMVKEEALKILNRY